MKRNYSHYTNGTSPSKCYRSSAGGSGVGDNEPKVPQQRLLGYDDIAASGENVDKTSIRILPHPIHINDGGADVDVVDCKQWAIILYQDRCENAWEKELLDRRLEDYVESVPGDIIPKARIFKLPIETCPPRYTSTNEEQFMKDFGPRLVRARECYERVRLLIHAIETEQRVRNGSDGCTGATIINIFSVPSGRLNEEETQLIPFQAFFTWLLIDNGGSLEYAAREYANDWRPSKSTLGDDGDSLNPVMGFVPPNQFHGYFSDYIIPALVTRWRALYPAGRKLSPLDASATESMVNRIKLISVDTSALAAFNEEPNSSWDLPYYVVLYHREDHLQKLPYYLPKRTLACLPYYIPHEDDPYELYMDKEDRVRELKWGYAKLPKTIKSWITDLHDNDDDPTTPIPVGIINLSTTCMYQPDNASIGDVRTQSIMTFLLEKFNGSVGLAFSKLREWVAPTSTDEDTLAEEDESIFSDTYRTKILPHLSNNE